jgi:hypothetical protein
MIPTHPPSGRKKRYRLWGSLGWILGGVALIGVGLTIWFTAFVLVPLGAIFIIIGIVTALRARREPPEIESGQARRTPGA